MDGISNNFANEEATTTTAKFVPTAMTLGETKNELREAEAVQGLKSLLILPSNKEQSKCRVSIL